MDDLKWSKSKITYMPAKRHYCKEYSCMCLLLAVSSSTVVYQYRDYFSTSLLSCLYSWMHASTDLHKLCCRHQVGSHHVPAFHVNLVHTVIHLTHFCLYDQTVYFKPFICSKSISIHSLWKRCFLCETTVHLLWKGIIKPQMCWSSEFYILL